MTFGKFYFILSAAILATGSVLSQSYNAGFTSFQLKDSSRIYKAGTPANHPLHYRPVDIDVWYPSLEEGTEPLKFGDLFGLFEQRAVNYQDNADYTGIIEELAQYYVVLTGVATDGDQLLNIETNSYSGLSPSLDNRPVILYLAGFNGMGYENYPLLEKLTGQGYIVVSIWSAGRYPGDMTNEKEDMMEQLYDAEFALSYLKKDYLKNANSELTGIIGCSWGGMSAAVFINRNKGTSAFLSLDGTETHYFGAEDQNDAYIREIIDLNLLDTQSQSIKYLYLESGDKLDEYQPTGEYHYYKNLKSEKYYLRFVQSPHGDFTCIPSILETSETSVQTYTDIEALGVSFFNDAFERGNSFKPVWKKVTSAEYTTDEPFSTDQKARLDIIGSIIYNKSKKPLPYVNIGILNQNLGTVSNSGGSFSLNISEDNFNDTLRISSIGFKPQVIPIRTLVNQGTQLVIRLEEQIDELDEVVIKTKAYKQKVLGNKTESKFIGTGFGYDQLGAEMGIKVNIKNNPTFVDSFSFYVTHNRLSASSIFRLNIYSAESKKPGLNLLKENILVTINPKETGKFTIELKEKNIVLYDDVYITLEWVDIDGENNKGEAIFFPIGFFNSGTLYKSTSQAKFKKHSGMGVGFTLDVRY